MRISQYLYHDDSTQKSFRFQRQGQEATRLRQFYPVSRWYKVRHGLVFDTRFAVVARRAGLSIPEVLALWLFTLDCASQNRPRGSLAGIDAETAAAWFQLPVEKILGAFSAFAQKKMIVEEKIENWEKEQSPSTKRVRAYRARKKTLLQSPHPSVPEKPLLPPAAVLHPDSPEAIRLRRERMQKSMMDRKNPAYSQAPGKETSRP